MTQRDLRNLKRGIPNIKLIEGNDQIRVGKCVKQIQDILDQYDCVMVPEVIISGKQIISTVRVNAKPREPKIIQ